MSPRRGSKPRPTDRLVVGSNVTLNYKTYLRQNLRNRGSTANFYFTEQVRQPWVRPPPLEDL
jgi:hypothetical protein